MSSSKSLPSNFKQKYPHNNSTISYIQDKSINDNSDIIINSSSLSSSVKKSSPLTKASWFNQEINDSSTISNKSWLNRRWSTVSGSLVVRQRLKNLTATQLWLNRQKRRTYPPCVDILRQEQKRFPVFKRQNDRQSLADILATFYSGSSDSSSVSKRIGKILKKKGKQPYNKKLHINTQKELKAATIFQLPPTISSKSSSPSTQIKFPTPPKRFSAIYIDVYGKQGKVDYVRSTNNRPQYLLNLIQHGVPHTLPMYSKITTTVENDTNNLDEPSYCLNKYNSRLSMYATLFVFGFIFFPLWWIGAWLHYRQEQQYCNFDLFSVRTFAYLNVIFTVMSLALLIVIISLIIWLAKI